VEVTDALRALGGAARWKQLRGHVGWRALKRARAGGAVESRDGLYYLVGTAADRVLAGTCHGLRSHETAAERWGFALPPADERVHVTISPNASRPAVPDKVELHYRSLPLQDQNGDVTSPARTVIDCLRDGTLRVALSVGDSALRSGKVLWIDLDRAVRALRGPGSRVARDRLAMLDARAANAFESCARAILIEAGVTGFETQVSIRHAGAWVGRVDLAHRGLRIVIECDGFEFHSDRAAFAKDLVRFTMLVAGGWRPLRFTWAHVMFQEEWVLARVLDVLGQSGAVQKEPPKEARRCRDPVVPCTTHRES
jgi:very-short-patch-repair endonuclease